MRGTSSPTPSRAYEAVKPGMPALRPHVLPAPAAHADCGKPKEKAPSMTGPSMVAGAGFEPATFGL